jgi:hypothetical protein
MDNSWRDWRVILAFCFLSFDILICFSEFNYQLIAWILIVFTVFNIFLSYCSCLLAAAWLQAYTIVIMLYLLNYYFYTNGSFSEILNSLPFVCWGGGGARFCFLAPWLARPVVIKKFTAWVYWDFSLVTWLKIWFGIYFSAKMLIHYAGPPLRVHHWRGIMSDFCFGVY